MPSCMPTHPQIDAFDVTRLAKHAVIFRRPTLYEHIVTREEFVEGKSDLCLCTLTYSMRQTVRADASGQGWRALSGCAHAQLRFNVHAEYALSEVVRAHQELEGRVSCCVSIHAAGGKSTGKLLLKV